MYNFSTELLEMIFLHLDSRHIVRASGVCKDWHDCVIGSRKLLQKIHKLPIPCKNNEDPHFEDPNDESRNATVPKRIHIGKPVLELYNEANISFLEDMKPGKFVEDQELQIETYGITRYEYRAAFKDVRYPNGWPAGLREIHCNLCDGFHTSFRFESVHPLLSSFLQDMTLCFQGHGPLLLLKIKIVVDCDAPKSCFGHYCAEVKNFGESLWSAHNMMDTCMLHEDLFTSPTCKRLAAQADLGYHVADNPEGITLADAIPFLIRAFKSHLSSAQSSLYSVVSRGARVTRHWRIVRDQTAAYPTEEDWRTHTEDYSDIMKMFNEVVWEVHSLMKGVAAWDETQLWIEPKEEFADDFLDCM